MTDRHERHKRWLLPETPDVIGMLCAQAATTIEGIDALAAWGNGDVSAADRVRAAEHAADDQKRELWRALREAFTTPLDPEDLYHLSAGLDEVLNHAKDVVREAEVLTFAPGGPEIAEMVGLAAVGVRHLADAFALVHADADAATAAADAAVKSQRQIEKVYRRAMPALLDARRPAGGLGARRHLPPTRRPQRRRDSSRGSGLVRRRQGGLSASPYTRRRDRVGVHAPRPSRPGPDGRCHREGPEPPPGGGPVPGHMEPDTASKIASGAITKGDVLAVARVAGIQAAKQTPSLLPLCHPLLVGSVFVNFRIEESHVEVEAQVDCVDRTGVEMEAMTACAVAALTIYDMCKSIDRAMTIGELALWEKTGGRSGHYRRPSDREFGD